MGAFRVGWGEAREQIKRACKENPEVSYLQVFRDWRNDLCQLWRYDNLIFVTRVDKEIDGLCLVLCLMAGRDLFPGGYDLERELQVIAEAYNCQKIKVIGRKGWERLLTPLGYKLQTIEMVKYVKQNGYRYHYATKQTRSPYGSPVVWGRR